MNGIDAIEALQRAIERGRSFCGVPRLSAEQVRATALEWDVFLKANGVPRDRYDDCFEYFMRSERQSKFTVYDMRDAWWRIKEKENKLLPGVSDEEAECPGCLGTGWSTKELVKTSSGDEWRKLERIIDGFPYSFTRPCSCRVGRRFDKSFYLAADANRKAMDQLGMDYAEDAKEETE